jgi:hypothetical protein
MKISTSSVSGDQQTQKKMLLTTPIISHIVQEDSDVSEDYMSQNTSDETHWALKKLDVMHQAYKAAA